MNNLPDFTALKPLAQGNTAEIYDYPPTSPTADEGPHPAPEKILKLFRPGFPLEPVFAEYEKSQLISRELDNVPKVYDLITCQNRHGIVYEKVCGPSLMRAMLKVPHQLGRNSRALAEIHFALHAHSINLGYTVKDKLAADIDAAPVLTSAEKSRIKSYLRALPDGDALLHFDFHPGNILLRPASSSKLATLAETSAHIEVTASAKHTPVVIDWMTACVGDPCADVARTYLLLNYGELAHANFIARQAARPFSSHIGRVYLATYLELSHLSRTDVDKWLLPVAAARLREWITPHEQDRLLKLIRSTLPNITNHPASS